MGGVGGRTDGVCGAVECQKSSGSLHFHFWAFIQRAHQMHTLEEIANMLESALLNADDLKRFCAHMCCESYPDEKAYAGAQKDLEKRCPQLNEKDDAIDGAVPEWGMYRFGRVAPFIFWSDTGLTYGDCHEEQVMGVEGSTVSDATDKRRELNLDAAAYTQHFSKALQENQMCAQHHIHKKSSTTGERLVPNACRASSKQNECKHGFPQLERINRKRPLLVCKGIAKARNLSLKGKRNALGSILGLRNCEWLNGTAPGFCLGLSGGNTDVKLNDRLPAISPTHESEECQRGCVPDDPERRNATLAAW